LAEPVEADGAWVVMLAPMAGGFATLAKCGFT